jgi:hypothetical protein
MSLTGNVIKLSNLLIMNVISLVNPLAGKIEVGFFSMAIIPFMYSNQSKNISII